jgi:hypothetical protein
VDRAGRQRVDQTALEDDVLERLVVGDHREDRVGAADRAGHRISAVRAGEVVRARRRAVPDGEVEAGGEEVASHRVAHVAETHQCNAHLCILTGFGIRDSGFSAEGDDVDAIRGGGCRGVCLDGRVRAGIRGRSN